MNGKRELFQGDLGIQRLKLVHKHWFKNWTIVKFCSGCNKVLHQVVHHKFNKSPCLFSLMMFPCMFFNTCDTGTQPAPKHEFKELTVQKAIQFFVLLRVISHHSLDGTCAYAADYN